MNPFIGREPQYNEKTLGEDVNPDPVRKDKEWAGRK